MNPDNAPPTLPQEPEVTRKGKVDHLPKALRDQINQMILDGYTYPRIIETLGDAGKDISESNLSNWRAGGYHDWLRHRQRAELIQSKHELAIDVLRQNAGSTRI